MFLLVIGGLFSFFQTPTRKFVSVWENVSLVEMFLNFWISTNVLWSVLIFLFFSWILHENFMLQLAVQDIGDLSLALCLQTVIPDFDPREIGRPRGRPPTRWEDFIKKKQEDRWKRLTLNRQYWKSCDPRNYATRKVLIKDRQVIK